MNDKKLNAILQKNNCRAVSSREFDVFGNKLAGIKRDSHTYKAKKEAKGVHWDSFLNDSVDRVDQFTKGKINEMEWSSEYYQHILTETSTFLELGLERGDFVEEDLLFFRHKNTVKLLELRNQGVGVPQTPGLLLEDYVSEIHIISTQLNDVMKEVVSLVLSIPKYNSHMVSEESDRWVIDKARRHNVLPKELNDRISFLIDRKARVHAEYKGRADTMKVGNSKLAEAAAFAIMWQEVMMSQVNYIKRADDEALQNRMDAFVTKFGIDPRSDERIMSLLRSDLPKKQFTRLSSVLSLFPTGALQFLDFIENKRIMEYKKPVQYVNAFFTHPEMTDSRRELAKSWEGKQVLLHDGKVFGTEFQFATTDYLDSGFASDPRKLMTKLGCPKEQIDSVCSHNYTRGGRVWTGGYQSANVLFVQTTTANGGANIRNGVKLWLENVQPVTLSEEVLAEINRTK